MSMTIVHLKRGRAKPFYYGHPWIFSGSIARVEGQRPNDGDIVFVVDDKGDFVAKGIYNGQSQIRVRLLSWTPEEVIDGAFFEARLRHAVALREDTLRLPERTEAYRLVHSEGDGLSGLIVDRYGDWLVVEFHALGLAQRKGEIIGALKRVCPGRSLYERSDTDICQKEGVDPHVGVLFGEAPPSPLIVTLEGVRLEIDLAGGQKTGMFLDQRENYRAVAAYAEGRSVLDCFCYGGAFALFARCQGGAESAMAIDQSRDALALARRNAHLNRVGDIELVRGNVFSELRQLRTEERTFGMVVLDPPKFVRSTGDLKKGLRGYKDINLVAMQCLESGGVLVTCSCSQHVDDATFEGMLNDAANDVGREVQVLERRSQSPDHPVAVSCPETRYLKCYICRVL